MKTKQDDSKLVELKNSHSTTLDSNTTEKLERSKTQVRAYKNSYSVIMVVSGEYKNHKWK